MLDCRRGKNRASNDCELEFVCVAIRQEIHQNRLVRDNQFFAPAVVHHMRDDQCRLAVRRFDNYGYRLAQYSIAPLQDYASAFLAASAYATSGRISRRESRPSNNSNWS